MKMILVVITNNSGCFLESWTDEAGKLSSIRRGCYDFSQKPGESFTEFIQTKTCDENKCNYDQPDFKKKVIFWPHLLKIRKFQFSTNEEGSGDDQNDDEEIDDTFFNGIFSTISEKDFDDSITTVVTIGTEKYETASGDGEEDDFSGSGDGEEEDSIFIPEIIRRDFQIVHYAQLRWWVLKSFKALLNNGRKILRKQQQSLQQNYTSPRSLIQRKT